MNNRFFSRISGISGILALVLQIYPVAAQEGDYFVRIKQPVLDTIRTCPGKSIVFMSEGQNSDGSSFDPNQVLFTWDFGFSGQSRTGANVTYSFPDGGHYIIRLYVTSITGGPSAKNVPEIHVFVAMPPLFTGTRSDNTSICSGNELTLTGFVTPVPWDKDGYPYVNSYNPVDFDWDGQGIQSDRQGIARIRPPLGQGHLNYIFRVKDNFECIHDTSFTLYGVFSNFTMEPKTGEAPLKVDFKIDSASNGGNENSINYQFEFYEVTDTSKLLTTNNLDFSFDNPGVYVCRLISTYQQCTNRFVHEEYIRVDSSLLEIPNVFTPNEDGANDYFQVKARSLKTFKGIILNRWGKVVYEWTDPKIKESGWNGKFQNSGQEMPAGTYYYIITATGYDFKKTEDGVEPIEYKGGVYKGFVTLIR